MKKHDKVKMEIHEKYLSECDKIAQLMWGAEYSEYEEMWKVGKEIRKLYEELPVVAPWSSWQELKFALAYGKKVREKAEELYYGVLSKVKQSNLAL